MILALYILVTYVLMMQMLKDDIYPLEHLCVLIIFSGILFLLATKENKVIQFIAHIESIIGWPHNHVDIGNLVTAVEPLVKWLIADYKSSNCRKWIKRVRTYSRRIFSSFM